MTSVSVRARYRVVTKLGYVLKNFVLLCDLLCEDNGKERSVYAATTLDLETNRSKAIYIRLFETGVALSTVL
jgi:hypothetical protein